MGLLKSITNSVKKVYNSTVGDLINPSNVVGKAVTGLSNSDQLGVGALGALGVASGAVGLGGSSSGSWLSSLFSGGLGILTDVLKDKYNIQNQKEMAKYNANQQLRLNQDAFNKNLEMWNMENAYNSPAEQMARFEAAGLNKNLIYDQQNVAGSGPTFQAPQFSTGQFNPVDTRMQRAQLALAMQEHQAQIKNQQIENMMKLQSLGLAERTADREDRLASAQIKSLENNYGLRYAELENTLNGPKSWIGRNWSDIKFVGQDGLNKIKDWVNSPGRTYKGAKGSNSYNWIRDGVNKYRRP